MRDLFLDPSTGDLAVHQVRLTETGSESIAQKVTIRLRFFYKEWILNTEAGTRWFERILRKGATKYNADQEIRRRILETQGVRGLENFTSVFDNRNRTYSCRFTIITNDDEQISIALPSLGV